MFRRRQVEPSSAPEWERRLAASRSLIEQQHPPTWVLDRLDEFARAVASADADRTRLRASLERLDADRAARELKDAMRAGSRSPEHDRLVASLRARYESIHAVQNRVDDLDTMIERSLVDADVLATRSVVLAGDEAWRLDATLQRLDQDLTALRLAHDEVSGL